MLNYGSSAEFEEHMIESSDKLLLAVGKEYISSKYKKKYIHLFVHLKFELIYLSIRYEQHNLKQFILFIEISKLIKHMHLLTNLAFTCEWS